MAGEPSFFSLGVQDVERGRGFYVELFGWRMDETRGGFAITTTGVPGGVHGGDPQASPYLFFRVENLDEALARVHALGGSVEDADHGDEDERGLDRTLRSVQAVPRRSGVVFRAASAACVDLQRSLRAGKRSRCRGGSESNCLTQR